MCNFPLPCNSLPLMPSLKTPFPPLGSISAELWGNSILLMMRQISGLLKLANTSNYTATILNLTRKIIISTEEIRPFSLSFSLSLFFFFFFWLLPFFGKYFICARKFPSKGLMVDWLKSITLNRKQA